ncbi:hypothetical protein VNO80_24384 [Phaseolus coccineus]|uniref:Uncharacterized protein n=1 Tax=Phaseolus coccineus TaxID=3886 RepID=A0AAN9LVX0_PHACN
MRSNVHLFSFFYVMKNGSLRLTIMAEWLPHNSSSHHCRKKEHKFIHNSLKQTFHTLMIHKVVEQEA